MPAKFNMRPDKNKMPSQDPKQRAKNFKETEYFIKNKISFSYPKYVVFQ